MEKNSSFVSANLKLDIKYIISIGCDYFNFLRPVQPIQTENAPPVKYWRYFTLFCIIIIYILDQRENDKNVEIYLLQIYI